MTRRFGGVPASIVGGAVVLALTGCGDADDGDADDGGKPVEGCVDVVLSPAVLPDPVAWIDTGRALPGGLWASPERLHLSWVAYRFYPEGSSSPLLSDTMAWLIITTVDPATGVILAHQTHALFPDGVLAAQSGVRSFAGRSDGVFAVGYEWIESTGTYPPRVSIGRLGQTSFTTGLSLPVAGDPGQIALHRFAGWDGEAFAMHAYGGLPQFTLHVGRVSDQGVVLLPLTQYGVTANGPPSLLSYRTSTSAESGRSYSFDAAGKTILNGHLRDGTPLPGTENGPKTVMANDAAAVSAARAAISADLDGAWAAWRQASLGPDSFRVMVQRLGLNGDEVGAAASIGGYPPADTSGIDRWTLVSRGASVSFFAASGMSLYRFDYDGSTLSKPARLLEPGAIDEIDVRDMEALEVGGETWVSYSQNKGGFYLRALKAKPGCLYPTNPAPGSAAPATRGAPIRASSAAGRRRPRHTASPPPAARLPPKSCSPGAPSVLAMNHAAPHRAPGCAGQGEVGAGWRGLRGVPYSADRAQRAGKP